MIERVGLGKSKLHAC